MKFAADTTIMIKDRPATGGCKILAGFTSPFTATAVEKAVDGGMEFTGQTETTEFSISGLEKDTVIDGDAFSRLSGAGCDAVLCNDFSGLLRRNISCVGGCYIHPTYGSVSRLGLIASMTSADQIGVAAGDVDKCFKMLGIIAGHDGRDGTSAAADVYNYTAGNDISGLHIGVFTNIQQDSGTRTAIELLRRAGAQTVDLELPYARVLNRVMYIIACAEISNNINRLDGVKYGLRAEDYKGVDDMYTKTRTQGLGIDTKLACVMGALVLSEDFYEKYYDKAMRVRRLFAQEIADIFKNVDAAVLPQKFEDKPNYEGLTLTAPAVLAGLPSLSMSLHGGSGVQLLADRFSENILYSIGRKLQKGVK